MNKPAKTSKSSKLTKSTKSTKAKQKAQPISSHGKVFITSTFNNTLVTITDDKGNTISWGSSGASGFKGTRRSTPYAATVSAEAASKKALGRGIQTVDVFVKGPGSGRDAALRAVKTAGLSISLIADVTPIPHNGPRPEKKRRI